MRELLALADARRTRPSAERSAARALGRHALRSLYAELVLYPKPGLVSMGDSGAHTDMSAATFIRSLFALRGYFASAAALGMSSARFASLQRLGMEAEARMMRATRGVNTHRGAIFTLGLFAAAAGVALAERGFIEKGRLSEILRTRWTREREVHRAARDPSSHGGQIAARLGAPGALGEAIAGFPRVFQVALPALDAALDRGASEEQAQLHALFSLLAVVDDTNVLHRGGAAGLARVQRRARDFLAHGSVFARDYWARACHWHRVCSTERLSPGGSADLLAAAWFAHLVETKAP